MVAVVEVVCQQTARSGSGGARFSNGARCSALPGARDREDEPDFADIGGETSAATHAGKDNAAGGAAQAIGNWDSYWNAECQAVEFEIEIGEHRAPS
jgi:hypothetical protein